MAGQPLSCIPYASGQASQSHCYHDGCAVLSMLDVCCELCCIFTRLFQTGRLLLAQAAICLELSCMGVQALCGCRTPGNSLYSCWTASILPDNFSGGGKSLHEQSRASTGSPVLSQSYTTTRHEPNDKQALFMPQSSQVPGKQAKASVLHSRHFRILLALEQQHQQ